MEIPADVLPPSQRETLQEAVEFSMREMLIHQPDNPLDFVAKCLKRFANGEAEDSDPSLWNGLADDCLPPSDYTMRRKPVFCPAPQPDEDWAPPVHSKTDGQVEMLLRVLERHAVLGRLSRDQQFLLIDAMEEQFCEGGDVLCREGDWLTCAYFVEEGALDVMGPAAFSLGPHDAACEECLLYPCRARATIRAAQDTNAWALDADVYRRIVRETVEKEDAMLLSRLAGSDLFGWMSDAQRQRALPACALVDFDAGECVWGEGCATAEDDAALVVVEGVLREEREDGSRDAAAGEVVGQAVFLRESHDVRRIVAAREGYAIRVDRAAVDRVLGDVVQLQRAQR